MVCTVQETMTLDINGYNEIFMAFVDFAKIRDATSGRKTIVQISKNFANGLRPIDSFAAWFKDVVDTMDPVYKRHMIASHPEMIERDPTPLQ